MHAFFRSLIRGFVRLLFRLGLKLAIEGGENLPPGGPLLIIGNHFSIFEAPMLMVFLPYRDRVTWLAATELQTSRILKALIDLFNIIPIWRGQPDRTAIHRALDWLAAGNIVGIMPEGGVDETLRPLTMAGVQPGLHEGPNSRANPVLITPRPGAAYLAVRSGAPILPVAFLGTEQIMPNLRAGVRPAGHRPGLAQSRAARPAGRDGPRDDASHGRPLAAGKPRAVSLGTVRGWRRPPYVG